MARIARVVAPGLPHHVTQRGNRRQQTFFSDADYRLYLSLLSKWCERRRTRLWSYCLMPNHVHLIVVPESEDGLRRSIGETHRRYTRAINFRNGWRGHLWQGRFASYVMDESYLLAAARYVELNPVKAGLVERAVDYPWSSACHHMELRNDPLVQHSPLKDMVDSWAGFLAHKSSDIELESLRKAESTGRPLGSAEFLTGLERMLERPLRKKKPGPKAGGELSMVSPELCPPNCASTWLNQLWPGHRQSWI